MITVALIDDHLIVRSGFAQLLGLEPDLQVVAEFGSGSEALAGLPGRGVQVCICDISMPDISGLELLSQLPKGMAIIMLSVHDSPALVEQALNAGARGFLSKRCSPDELIAAVRRQLARDRVEAFVQSMAVLGYHRSELPVLLQESGAQAQ